MRRWTILAAAGLLAFAAVGYWGYNQRIANRSLEVFLDNKYQRAFFDMTNQVQNLEVLLSKSMVVADPRLDLTYLMDLRQQAAFAQANLGQLPVYNDALAGRTSKFLTQVGDYADSLARQIGKGGAVNEKQWDTLNDLYQQSTELNRDLQGMQYKIAQNNYYFSELVRQVRKNLQHNPPENIERSDFQLLDERMQQYPALIYDGPFSEHLEQAEPKGLGGLEEISPEEAQNKALAFVFKKPGVEYHATEAVTTNGRIPSYRVEVMPVGEGNGDRTMMDIARKGGRTIWMLNSRPVGGETVDLETAKQNAARFLEERDFGEMQPTYSLRHENTATFNYAAVQDGVIIYPDLVKVSVALDNGEVIGAETSGYLMSHRERDLPAPKISQQQARAALSNRLEISGGRLVLIPVGVSEEQLAYEFQGKLGQETFLVYVNAVNGREENVLKLIETPGGTLTM